MFKNLRVIYLWPWLFPPIRVYQYFMGQQFKVLKEMKQKAKIKCGIARLTREE